MVILVVFNSFNVVQNLKMLDPVARQMPPFYTTDLPDAYMSIVSIDLDFLLRSAQNCKKMHSFGQFKDHNSKREHGN